MNTAYAIGGGGAAVILAAGFLLVLPSQNQTLSEKADALAAVEASNDAAQVRIPKLKQQLAGIAPRVDALRALATQVPADINQPDLLDDLTSAAQQAGLSGISNMSISLPVLVKNAQTAPAASDEDSGDAGTATKQESAGAGDEAGASGPGQGGGQGGAAVIASYNVSLSAQGTPEQLTTFLALLRQIPRLNVVSSASMQVGTTGQATLSVTTRLYLQKVDMEGLAEQIESLNASVGSPSPDRSAAPEATASSAPSPQPSGQPSATASRAASPSAEPSPSPSAG